VEPSSSLLEGVKKGDRQAWERLVKLYAPLVYVWCRRWGLQAADAADVGQEVFQAVARKVAEFRRDRAGDSFRGWMRTITRHKVCDLLRRQHPEPLAEGGKEEQTAPQPCAPSRLEDSSAEEDREEVSLLYRRALELISSHFEEQTRRAFWAVVIDNRSVADVAGELRMTSNAVYLAKARVLRRLRLEFADLLDP